MVLSRVRLIRVGLVLVNLNPINDTYITGKMRTRSQTSVIAEKIPGIAAKERQ